MYSYSSKQTDQCVLFDPTLISDELTYKDYSYTLRQVVEFCLYQQVSHKNAYGWKWKMKQLQ